MILATLTIGPVQPLPPITTTFCPSAPVDLGYSGPVDRCGFPLQATPGPLPIAAVGGAWVWSRKLRARVRQAGVDRA